MLKVQYLALLLSKVSCIDTPTESRTEIKKLCMESGISLGHYCRKCLVVKDARYLLGVQACRSKFCLGISKFKSFGFQEKCFIFHGFFPLKRWHLLKRKMFFTRINLLVILSSLYYYTCIVFTCSLFRTSVVEAKIKQLKHWREVSMGKLPAKDQM